MYQFNQILDVIEILPLISMLLSLISLIIALIIAGRIKRYRADNELKKKIMGLDSKINSLEIGLKEKVSKNYIEELRNNIASINERVKNLETKLVEDKGRQSFTTLPVKRPFFRGTMITPQSFQQYISSSPLLSSGIIFDSSGMIIETAGIDSSEGERMASYMYEVIRNSREAMIRPEIILFQSDKGYGALLKLSEINGTEIFALLHSRVQPSFTQCLVIRDTLKRYVEKTFKRVRDGE